MKRYLILLAISFAGCVSHEHYTLAVLAKAGKNRQELEKVLDHYRTDASDSLKYKAALFLISNMEDKFSYSGKRYARFLHFIDSISSSHIRVEDYKTDLARYLQGSNKLSGAMDKTYDIETLSSGFLISNIDQAFTIYRSAPWFKDLSFEDFCEYVLPYRYGNEPLESFRDSLFDKFSYLQQYRDPNRQQIADSILRVTSKREMEIMYFPGFVPDFPLSSLQILKGGTCSDATALALYIMRTQGLPVAADFTPQWPHRGMGHSWCSLIISQDSCIDFEGATAPHVGGHLNLSNRNSMAKAYRHTYGKQPNSLAMLHGDEPIPDFFTSPYFKDVSTRYFKCINIPFVIPDTISNRYAYVCVFDDKKWFPIHWGAIRDHRVSFSDMGKPAVYLPAIFKDDHIQPVANPVIADSAGNIHEIVPDEKVFQRIVLTRKYPVFNWWNTRTMAMLHGRFQAASKEDFSDAVDAYRIDEIPEMTYQTVRTGLKKGYKYWRYLSPDSSNGSIAELEFYDRQNHHLTGRVIGTDSTRITGNGKSKVFDNEPLTFFEGDYPNGNWVGMAFDKPESIDHIRYLCWNDDNFIKNGEQYELYYWKNGAWKSLGAKKGDNSQILIYNHVPSKALYLLRNHTKGKEERIFTYENGKQKWW